MAQTILVTGGGGFIGNSCVHRWHRMRPRGTILGLDKLTYAELGHHLKARLEALRSPMIQEIRCIGLWAGIQLRPEAGPARAYCEALKDRGLLCRDTHTHTLRLAPPLVITREELDWAVDQVEEVLQHPDHLTGHP